MKVTIAPATGSTKETKVIQVDLGTKSVEVDLNDLPVELQFAEPTTGTTEDATTSTPFEIPSDSSATPITRLTKQTGTHLITTTNGFSQTGTMEELASALSSYGISLTFEGDEVMVFENQNFIKVDVEITAQGRSGRVYAPIEQDNNAVTLSNKNAKFRLAEKIAQREPDPFPDYVG